MQARLPSFPAAIRNRNAAHSMALRMALCFLTHSGLAEVSSNPEAERTALAVEALSKLPSMDIETNPKLKEAVLKVLPATRGTPDFVKLVKQFSLKGQDEGLLQIAATSPRDEWGVEAMRLVLGGDGASHWIPRLQDAHKPEVKNWIEALGNTASAEAVPVLLPMLHRADAPLDVRKECVRALTQSQEGCSALLRSVRDDQLSLDLRFAASAALGRVRWPAIQSEAALLMPPAKARGAEPLPPLAELMQRSGDVLRGKKVFFTETAACSSCHQVDGLGVDFGPNLSAIGAKLGKDALYEAILDPSAGISFGYEGWQIELKSGGEAYGLITSETPDELAVKDTKGIVARYNIPDIAHRQRLTLSVMPAGLQEAMTPQELVDLVEYLASLKKP